MTLALATIFLIALASLCIGGGMPRRQRQPVAMPAAIERKQPAPLSPLTKALDRQKRLGLAALPIEREILSAYGGDDIPYEAVEPPARRKAWKLDDEIPY